MKILVERVFVELWSKGCNPMRKIAYFCDLCLRGDSVTVRVYSVIKESTFGQLKEKNEFGRGLVGSPFCHFYRVYL